MSIDLGVKVAIHRKTGVAALMPTYFTLERCIYILVRRKFGAAPTDAHA